MLGLSVAISLEAVYQRNFAPYCQTRGDMHAMGIVAAVAECVAWRAAIAWREEHARRRYALPLPAPRKIRA